MGLVVEFNLFNGEDMIIKIENGSYGKKMVRVKLSNFIVDIND